jgi:CubicO group peptidase (beta-lactamase class C family)
LNIRHRATLPRVLALATLVVGVLAPSAGAQPGLDVDRFAALQHELRIAPPGGVEQTLDLDAALRALHIPSVSIALIEHGDLAGARAFGDASTRTLYQAASMSKFVAAVGALRLVKQGRLGLDRDVNDELVSWHLPASNLTDGCPVTLRGLLSMTGGIGAPGYLGYPPGAPLPSLVQILNGAPPANSPPVEVEHIPGQAYAYSGGGYEIVQALIQDSTRQPFAQAMQDLLLGPSGMSDSTFAQPPPATLLGRVATGHYTDGTELPGGWRVVPELAAGGLWSTPTDLARLLVIVGRAYRGEDNRLLDRVMAGAMLSPQNGGPYGLGAALAGSGRGLVLMKRGQNVGYQGYLLMFPETGQGMVVMTGSDNGTTLATALLHRAAMLFHWPPLGALLD